MERVSPAVLEELLRRMTDYELEEFKIKCQKNDIPLDKFNDKRLASEDSANTTSSAVPDARYLEQLSKPELVDLVQHRLTDEQLGRMLEKLREKDTNKLLERLSPQQVLDALSRLDDGHLNQVLN